MDGRKLGFGLGVLVVVVAIVVVVFIDRSHAPTKTDGRELDPPSEQRDAGSGSDDTPAMDAQLQRKFGGVTITQAGGIAGISNTVNVDADLRATFTSRTDTRTVPLDAATKRSILRSVAKLAAEGDHSAPAEEPYPDQMTTTISFVWDGKQLDADTSSTSAEPLFDLLDS